MHLKSFLRWLPVAVLPALTLWAAVNAPPNLPAALDVQLELARQNPDDASVFNDLGNLLALAGDPDDAEDAYLHALSLEPSKASARYNLGLLYDREGKHKRALNQFQRLVKDHPDHAWGHYQVGVQQTYFERDERAVRAYARAFTLDPELTFAEVNPHVLDNPFYTRALMLMDKEKATGQLSPRMFDASERIVSILVAPPPEMLTDGEEPEDMLAEEEIERLETGDAEVVQVEPTDERRVNQGQPVNRAVAPTRPTARAPGETRTLTNSDLDPDTQANQAGRGNNRPRAGRVRQLPTTVGRPVVVNPQAQPGALNPTVGTNARGAAGRPNNPPQGRVRYRPGTNSTGRLDIELIPVGPGGAVDEVAAG